MLLAEQGACVMRYCLICLLNSGVPYTGVAASVFVLHDLGPTAVVVLMMPLAFFFFFLMFILAVLGLSCGMLDLVP